ncbi:MAG: hypothetical protein ACRDK7_07995 [Solirubrobacteraceae bacterium]
MERLREIQTLKHDQLVGELIAGQWEDPIRDQKPPRDRSQRRTALLAGGLDIATLENESGQTKPSAGLGELACGGGRELVLVDIATRGLEDAIVVEDASEAERPLYVIVAGDESLPKRFWAGRVQVNVLLDIADVRALTHDHQI